MLKYIRLVLLLAVYVLITSAPVAASPFNKHHITIVGENHRHIESSKWFFKSVAEYVNSDKCLNVALEVGSDQQPIINKVMKNERSDSDIKISSIIDHLSYREMLIGFRRLINDGRCLKIYAIDAPRNMNTNRDRWMAKRIKDINDESIPIAILLGNLHVLKQVNWYPSAHGEPFLAEILQNDGMDVYSIIQSWPSESCRERSIKHVTDVGEVLRKLLEPVAAYNPIDAYSVVDAAVVWKCP